MTVIAVTVISFTPVNIDEVRKRYWQGRLNSIIGPGAKRCSGAPTYTTTHRNKNVNDR
jgi:patatin-like phospholipase/acyl hydrolase